VETMVRIPEETPLVGFHGRSDGTMLNSLGLIFFNAKEPACLKQPRVGDHHDSYEGSIFEQSEAAERAITK